MLLASSIDTDGDAKTSQLINHLLFMSSQSFGGQLLQHFRATLFVGDPFHNSVLIQN